MACRLVNLHKFPLNVDLRGGETLVLGPGQTSRALLEELLYDNPFVREWEAAGWLARLPAKFADAQPQAAAEDAEAKPAAEPPETEAQTEEPAADAEDEADSESDEDDDPDAPHPKPRRRKKHR